MGLLSLRLRGTATPTYDANGNTLSDGTNTYVWNARNQLASMNLTGETFQYDPFGRRTAKTILGTTTNYLYDGANPVQELSGTTPTANMLTGGVDEYFTRTDSTGTANFLTDALGSTIQLTNSSGGTLASYTYEPFGNTTASGSSTNTYQYTGRENDGTGLYFYRARYYSPGVGRFISEDPLQFRANSVNFYELGYDDPINLTDPTGEQPMGGIVVSSGTGAAVSVTTTVTVTSTGGGSTPVFTLLAGGSGEGASAGPIGALVGVDVALLVNDVNGSIQLYHAYHPSTGSNPSNSSTSPTSPLPNTAGRGQCKGDDDDCAVQRENDESVCRMLPDPRARAACWRSAWERYQNCRHHVYVPPLRTDPD